MFPMNHRPIPVKVEYTDRNGDRVTKEFASLPKAKSFAIKQEKAGKQPKYISVIQRN